jgi:hypothetical protein
MPATTHGVQSGVCVQCHAKYTLVLTIERIGDGPPSAAPFTCPNCGRNSSLSAQRGQRSTDIAARAYVER